VVGWSVLRVRVWSFFGGVEQSTVRVGGMKLGVQAVASHTWERGD